MKRVIQLFIHLLLVLILTVLTQIGGFIYLLTLITSLRTPKKVRFQTLGVFMGYYLLFTFIIVPFTAPFLGREKINLTTNLQPATYLTVLTNRNYVTHDLQQVLTHISKERHVLFLDANFPFFNGFPLLPHLSHNDGRKVDLSFVYVDTEGKISDKTKSVSGYGIFEAPDKGELNQTKVCKEQGYFQYDYSKFFTLGKINPQLVFSKSESAELILDIVNHPQVEKVFLEPHLVSRMKLNHPKIRFHGCRAVRHDDHIHIQTKGIMH